MPLPKLKMLGDSVSMIGPSPYVATELTGIMDVYSLPENGQHSRRTQQALEYGCLAGLRFDAVTMGNMLHDVVSSNSINTAQYAINVHDNFRIIRSQQAGAKIFWLDGTFISLAATGPDRSEENAQIYAAALTDVWTANPDVIRIDLHTPTETNYVAWGNTGDGIHYNSTGYAAMAVIIATAVAAELGLAYP